MKVYRSPGSLDPDSLPHLAIEVDWFGEPMEDAAQFAFGIDPSSFHFAARHRRAACCHPDSRPGKFQAELWKYDVAEFFLSDPSTGHYLEFNLAPNGGWWSCLFTAPLQRLQAIDQPLAGVRTAASSGPGGWSAHASLPLPWLEEHLHFSPSSGLNATFILESPRQRFLTASPLGGGDPAFHRPGAFPPVTIVPR